MLKCGQKDNANYTFGVTDKQIKESSTKVVCSCQKCGKSFTCRVGYCSRCGAKI